MKASDGIRTSRSLEVRFQFQSLTSMTSMTSGLGWHQIETVSWPSRSHAILRIWPKRISRYTTYSNWFLKLAISGVKSASLRLLEILCVCVYFETEGRMFANLATKTRILAQPTSSFVSMRADNGKSSQGNARDFQAPSSIYVLTVYAQILVVSDSSWNCVAYFGEAKYSVKGEMFPSSLPRKSKCPKDNSYVFQGPSEPRGSGFQPLLPNRGQLWIECLQPQGWSAALQALPVQSNLSRRTIWVCLKMGYHKI